MNIFKKNKIASLKLSELIDGVFDDNIDRLKGDTFRREIASENLLDGNFHCAIEQIVEIVFDAFLPTMPQPENFVGVRFYDTTHLTEILQQIKARKLRLSKVDFNDAIDPLLAVYVKYKRQNNTSKDEQKWFELLEELMPCFRICCLCEKPNQLMWSHYAQSHRGICVQYSIQEKDFHIDKENHSFCYLAPINYKDKKVVVEDIELQDSLLLKSKQWSYEHEHRLIYFSKDVREINDVFLTDIQIDTVYAGFKISEKHLKQIKEALKETGIPLYRMEVNPKNAMELMETKIL